MPYFVLLISYSYTSYEYTSQWIQDKTNIIFWQLQVQVEVMPEKEVCIFLKDDATVQ